MRRILLLALFCSIACSVDAQTVPDCGQENERACSPADKEFWQTDSLACEYDLKLKTHFFHDDTCINSQRWTLDKDYSWAAWALSEQRYDIGAKLGINFITHLGTHNSYSNYRQGFVNILSADQYYSITDQLQSGARLIRLDPWWYFNEMRLCHAESVIECEGSSPGRLFAGAIREISVWLDANPDDVIIIRLHDSDSSLTDHKDYINDPIATYLGSRVFTQSIKDQGYQGRWPRMEEMLQSQFRVIILAENDYGSGWTFPYNKYVIEDRLPTPLLAGCSDPSTSTVATRAFDQWALISEDRSGSNSPRISNLFGSSLYPPLDEPQVTQASNCSFSNIELDFWQKLDWAYSDDTIQYSRSGPDLRREAAIWSWQDGDFGNRGPALLDTSSGRWRSEVVTNTHQLLCMKPDPTTFTGGVLNFGSPAKATWRVTSFSGAWNQNNGDQECAAEFGAGFGFSPPRNALQNQQALAAARGSTAVWVAHSAIPIPEPAVSPSAVRLIMQRGGTLPDPITVNVVGTIAAVGNPPNTFSAKINSGAQYFSFSIPNNILQLTGSALTISATSIASTLDVGLYEGTIYLYESDSTQRGGVISVTLEVDEPTTTTITATPSSMLELTPVVIAATVQGNPLPGFQDSITGTVVLEEIVTDPATSLTTVQELGRGFLASSDMNSTGPENQVKFNLTLSPTTHSLIARYLGDSHYSASDSAVITLSPIPLVRVTPTAVSFSISPSSPTAGPWTLAASDTLTHEPVSGTWSIPAANLSNGGRIPIYLDVSPAGAASSTATVTLDSKAFSVLSPGEYDLDISFLRSDKKPAPESSHFSMKILGSLSASASVVTLTAGSFASSVTVNGSSPMPITVNTNQTPWLSAAVASSLTPTVIVFKADPTGLAPGDYTANVTVSSPVSGNSVPLTVTLHLLAATSISTNVPNGSLVVDKQPYSSPATFLWEPGSHHNVQAAAVQTPDAGSRWLFQSWSDGGAAQHAVIVPSTPGGALSLVAGYAAEYLLSVSPVPAAGGTVTPSPTSTDGFYAAGTPVSLSAQPAAGYQFVSFTGGITGSTNPSSLVMNGSQSVGAVFSLAPPKTVDVQIVTSPPGLSVTVDGVSLSGGTTSQWQQGSTHTISAPATQGEAAGSRWAFTQWSDGGASSHSVTLSAGKAIVLTVLYRKQDQLTVVAQPASGGTVSGAGWYDENSNATISATAAQGYIFSGFSGLPQASVNPQSVTVNAPLVAQANFAAALPNIFASPGARADTPDGNRSVAIMLTNSGGPAVGARIDSITGIRVVTGSGDVHPTNILPSTGLTIESGGNANFTTLWTWPVTAQRVQFTVNFSTQAGYQGSTVLTMFR
jgi:Divergent InlB B-repeat domain